MKSLLNKTIKFVDESFGEKIPHYDRALFWLFKIKPDADLALQIAAYSHDIKRAFIKLNNGNAFRLQDKALIIHQEGGGKIMYDFLLSNGGKEELAAKVRHLISRHEWGGDSEQNLIKDADSLSYFETNAENHSKLDKFTKEEKINKFNFMFKRITSKRVRDLAKPYYEKVIDSMKEKE